MSDLPNVFPGPQSCSGAGAGGLWPFCSACRQASTADEQPAHHRSSLRLAPRLGEDATPARTQGKQIVRRESRLERDRIARCGQPNRARRLPEPSHTWSYRCAATLDRRKLSDNFDERPGMAVLTDHSETRSGDA
jgi:hypothetical protein